MPPDSIQPLVADEGEKKALKNGAAIRLQQQLGQQEHDALLVNSNTCDKNDSDEDGLSTGSRSTRHSSSAFLQMLRYAERRDYVLLAVGILCTLVYGVSPSLNSMAFRGLTECLTRAQAQYDDTGQIDLEWFTWDLLTYICFYGVLIVISFVSGYISMYCICTFCERQILVIRGHLFNRVLHQDIRFFDENNSGQLIERLSSSIDTIRNGTSDKLVLVASSSVSLVAGVFTSFYMHWKMGLVLVCLVPVIVTTLVGSAILVKPSLRREAAAYGMASSIAGEVLNHFRVVLAYCAQKWEIKRYAKHLQVAYKCGLWKNFINTLFYAAYIATLFGSMSIAFWYGTNLIIQGQTDPGSVIASFWAAMGGAIRFGQSLPHLSAIVAAKLSLKEVFELIDKKSEHERSEKSGLTPAETKGELDVDGLYFAYPTRADVHALGGVSFGVGAGKRVALVGQSGSGKTSLANLLMKFYQPTGGSIKLDGVPLGDLNTQWLRRQLAFVPQRPVIFSSLTVEENLKLGRDVPDEKMALVCKLANTAEFIKRLPKGYRTRIGTGGIELSGGQAQRLVVARALMLDPKILLFDEASSALDSKSAELLESAIDKISCGRTVLTITHRLPVKNADEILVLSGGELVEKGSHAELMEKAGTYHRLVTTHEDRDPEHAENYSNRDRKFSQRSKRLSESNSHLLSAADLTSMTDHENSPDEPHSGTDGKRAGAASFLRILRFARLERPWILAGFLVTLVRGATWPVFSIIYGRLFKSLSHALITKESSIPFGNYAEFVILALVAGTLAFLSGFLLGMSGEKLTKRMREELFTKLLYLDATFYDRNSVAALTARLSDASNVAAAIDVRLADVLQGVIALILGVCLGFWFDYRMATLGIFVPGAIVATQITLNNLVKSRLQKDSEASDRAATLVSESINQIYTIHATNSQRFFYDKYQAAAEKLYRKAKKRIVYQSISFGLMGAYFNLNFSTAYFLGLMLIRAGLSTPFLVFQTIESMSMGAFSVILVATYMPEFVRACVAAGHIFTLLDEEPRVDSASAGGLKPEINGRIALKGVFFAYPNNPDRLVLSGASVDVKPGQTLALVGPSGGGKSSVLQLVERHYDVLSGSIEFEGVDVRQINVEHLRHNMAMVEQMPTVFKNATIAENIAYGMENFQLETVIEVARQVNAHDFIDALPNRYDTVIGEEGNLSGGQAQRVCLARALIRNAKIMCFDEVTSGLDAENEQAVQEALQKACENRTCIVIAHRLNTIQSADLIAVVDQGRIREVGTHAELLKLNGLYSRLVLNKRTA